MKFLCAFYPPVPIKSKIGDKILSQIHVKRKLLSAIFNLVKFSLRPKNECVALVPFKLFAALNT